VGHVDVVYGRGRETAAHPGVADGVTQLVRQVPSVLQGTAGSPENGLPVLHRLWHQRSDGDDTSPGRQSGILIIIYLPPAELCQPDTRGRLLQ
jgi:hypothetical protein